MIPGQQDNYGFAFNPIGNTMCIAVTNTSADNTFTFTRQVIITNSGTNVAFISFGTTPQTTVIPVAGTPANGMPILPGTQVSFTLPLNATHMGALTASSTTTLYATGGEGE